MGKHTWSQDRYIAALRFAALAHGEQKVPGSEMSYVVHISQVAMEVIAALSVENVGDPDLAVQCALLHDVIEDTSTTDAQVEAAFGPAVAAGVQALSKDPALPKAEQMADSLRRIQGQPREVWMVKLADRISNLEPPPSYWTRERIAAYGQEAAQIRAVLGATSPYLSARLAARTAAYGAYVEKE